MEYIIIGAGLSGAVIARYIAEAGHRVKVWDRRMHIAGNMYDEIDKHGILIHKYGPHIFHTNKKKLVEYIQKFTEWAPYKLTYMAEINGIFTPTPFNFQTIDDFFPTSKAEVIKNHIKEYYKDRKTATVLECLQCEDSTIREYAQFLFDKDYSLYTAKQWGIDPKKVDPTILMRVPLRFSYDVGYFDDKYQLMPKNSYTDFFKNILNHHNITVELGVEALNRLTVDEYKKSVFVDNIEKDVTVIYTGALDELFGADDGELPYRSLRFEWKFEDIESKQPAPVVAYPEAKDYTRITEYKKLPIQDVNGTTYAIEFPLQYEAGKNQEPYYPLLTEDSQMLYKRYKLRADNISNLYYAGRLADYKYYNMDQALERGLIVSKSIPV